MIPFLDTENTDDVFLLRDRADENGDIIMRILFVLLVFTTISGADILWNWDFNELPSGWEANEYWDCSDSQARSYVSALTSGPGSCSETSEMYSDTMIVPDSVSLITVSVTSEWVYDGWATSGESNCYLHSELCIVGGSDHTLEFYSRGWGFDCFPSGQRSVVLDIPVNPGDLFWLNFMSHASSSYGAYAMMDWTVFNVNISCEGSALGRSSWGGIKSTFCQ